MFKWVAVIFHNVHKNRINNSAEPSTFWENNKSLRNTRHFHNLRNTFQHHKKPCRRFSVTRYTRLILGKGSGVWLLCESEEQTTALEWLMMTKMLQFLQPQYSFSTSVWWLTAGVYLRSLFFFEKDVFAENDGKHCERSFSVTYPMVRGRMYISARYGVIESA